MKDTFKTIMPYAAIIAGTIGGSLLAVRSCNNVWNNRTVNTPGYTLNSYATGLSGHVEYIRYSNGNYQDVKIYPGFGHRLFDSELVQDLDGDKRVDLIRKHSPELKMHRLSELLIREYDYESYNDRFDEADKLLHDLMEKYPLRK
ncbi:MAG TPA: hypothetical protein VJH68_00595 [Candidatus Nanoarchaeia archaeon]|nr:hypothetical protein [Candidatus Nanoarchaeia archaeon]